MNIVPAGLAVNRFGAETSKDFRLHRRVLSSNQEGKPEPRRSSMGQDGGESRDGLDEGQRIRRLQLMMDLVMQVIAQDPKLSVEEASQMVADSRDAALALFPGKELAFDLLYRPRFQRLMRERYRMQ
jgi:hypothetical protein